MKVDEIKSQEDLKKYLAETEADHAIVKAEAEKKAAEKEAELKQIKEELKTNRDKLAEVMSHNWVEKYSTSAANVKEEKLYRMGMYIKGIADKNRDLLAKYGSGKGAMALSADAEKSWGVGEYNVRPQIQGTINDPGIMGKAPLGSPLYSDAVSGSYLIPIEYMSEVAYVARQASQLMGQVTEIPMISRQKLFPIQNASATPMSWNVAQSSTKTEVDPTFTQGTLTTYTGAIWTSITDELQEDSIVPLAAYFRDIFGQAWGYEFDYQCTQSNANPFTGMLNGATNSYVLPAGGTTFDSFGYQDGPNTIQKLTLEMKRVGAKWIMHTTVLDNLRKLTDANGNPIYFNAALGGGPDNASDATGGRMNGNPGLLFGYPYITTDGMVPNSSSAVSTKFMIFGNPKYFYYGNRVGMEFKIFDQTYYAMQNDQIFFRMRLRAAFTTAVTGAFVAVATSAS